MEKNEEKTVLKRNAFNILNNKNENITFIDLSNQHFTNLNNNLILPIHLCEINLSHNSLTRVPQSIMDLTNIRKLDLSYNKIEAFDDLPSFCHIIEDLDLSNNNIHSPPYWVWAASPEEILQLQKLKVLSLNNNELCMLPNNWSNMKNLKSLDLYDNFLCDLPEIKNYDEIDLAQNYFEEPENDVYIEKQKKIRFKYSEQRYCGRKKEVVKEEWDHTPNLTDDELQWNENENNETYQNRPSSTSSEDWEAEDWWVPHMTAKSRTSPQSPWVMFIQKKINEGHFCPIDLHKEPINKVSQPKVFRTVSGQFDDYSDDDDN